MVQFAKGIFGRSVFQRIPENTAMNDILAILFHRLAATVYLPYFIWAALATFSVLGSFKEQMPHDQVYLALFVVAVLVTSGASCFGATFWPRLARLELFTGASFVGLLVFYLGFALVDIFNNPIPSDIRIANWVLLLSILVLPICRTIVVVLLLLRQAKEEDATRGN